MGTRGVYKGHATIIVALCLGLLSVVGLFGVRAQKVRADVTNGLVAKYSFDDISGTIVPDSSGNSRDGTSYGSPTVSTGRVGNGLRFDGTDDYVNIPHQLVSGQNPALTYSFFVKVDADSDDSQYFLAQASGGTYNNDCFNVSYNNVAHYIEALGYNDTNGPTVLRYKDLTEWTHLAVVNNPVSHQSTLYINGVAYSGLDASCSQSLVDQFILGRSPWAGYQQQLKGMLDEVRVYDRVLSHDEIQDLATIGNTNDIMITNPSDGSVLSNTVTLSATTSGTPTISSVQYYANGEAIGSPISSAPYSYAWDTTTMVQGDCSLVAVATDLDGNQLPSTVLDITIDNTPTIKLNSVRSTQQTSAHVVWTTDEKTTGTIEYGTTNAYGQQVSNGAEYQYAHDQKLSGLSPDTTYHYRIISEDGNGNVSTGADGTFTTLTAVDGHDWHVSASGSPSGDGSADDPWDLATALAQPSGVDPGDSIWLHGGTYAGTYISTLNGTASAPIIVRNYDNERVIIDGGTSNSQIVDVSGSYTWFWGLEVTSSNPTRIISEGGSNPTSLQRGMGFYIFGPGTRVINSIVHDTAQGFGFWTPATDAELYGNLVYYNGWESVDRGHGHGIYSQNNNGLKYIADNMVFKNFGAGLHVYSEGGKINSIMTQGNSFFLSGQLNSQGYGQNMLQGGYQIAENVIALENMVYDDTTYGGGFNIGYISSCDNATAKSNYLVASTAFTYADSCKRLDIQNNTFKGNVSGGMAYQFADNDYYSTAPSDNMTFLRVNQYDPERAYATVYNWQGGNSVDIDISDFLQAGDQYAVYDVQNYFGDPLVTGMVTGSAITVPTNLTEVASVVGNPPNEPVHSAKQFNAYVIIKTGHATAVSINDSQSSQSPTETNNITDSIRTVVVAFVKRVVTNGGEEITESSSPELANTIQTPHNGLSILDSPQVIMDHSNFGLVGFVIGGLALGGSLVFLTLRWRSGSLHNLK